MDALPAYALVALAGLLYAALVAWLREADPDHGLTAWLVVAGDALVAAGLWLRLGPAAALELLVLLAIAGIPQIVGYTVARTLTRRKAARETAREAAGHSQGDLGLR